MSEANKMYVLGYNDGVERAAQQCRFYAERTKDRNASTVEAYDELEQMILMLRMDSFRKKTLVEVFRKVQDEQETGN